MDMDHPVSPPAHDASLALVLGSDSEESVEHDNEKDGNWLPKFNPALHASSAKKGLKSHRINFSRPIGESGSDHDAEGEGSEDDFCLIDDYRKRVASKKNKIPVVVVKSRNHSVASAIGFNAGMYTEGENELFAEGLELYGREWGKVADHIGTRDVESVRSHAQKHFIRLYRDGKLLPAKVCESGEGYTMSGDPLDPKSAPAGLYLRNWSPKQRGWSRPGANRRVVATAAESNKSDIQEPAESIEHTEIQEPAEAIEHTEVSNTPQKKPSGRRKSDISTVEKPKKRLKLSRKYQTLGWDEPATDYSTDSVDEDANQFTAGNLHASGNPSTTGNPTPVNQPYQRPLPTPAIYQPPRPVINVHDHVHCHFFASGTTPASGVPDAQPFFVETNTVVTAMIDLHAHVARSEVIGLLAGEWVPSIHRLVVHAAFPCNTVTDREIITKSAGPSAGSSTSNLPGIIQSPVNSDAQKSLESRNNHRRVEMDPASAIAIRNEITKRGLRVVGWYHSHPGTLAEPSGVDVESQGNYQGLFKEGSDEPFVGVIVGPYGGHLPSSISDMTWFWVDQRGSSSSGAQERVPRRMVIELVDRVSRYESALTVAPSCQVESSGMVIGSDGRAIGLNSEDFDGMISVLRDYSFHPHRVEFPTIWRISTGQNCLQKLMIALHFRLVGERNMRAAAAMAAAAAVGWKVVPDRGGPSIGFEDVGRQGSVSHESIPAMAMTTDPTVISVSDFLRKVEQMIVHSWKRRSL
ncbi:hypothetical protein BJ742DRAFT_793256 [Cladochytrium replicatum]|nr:hypothetical protein BJ742DRAFT_793256 [Cladochytrium replicatum]